MEWRVRDRGSKLPMREHISVSSDRRGKVRVDGCGETVMPESVAADAAGTEVFGGEHASGSHDADESVECRLGGV